jgi:hypothetical protein
MSGKLPMNAQKIFSLIVDTEINLSVINKIELLGFSKLEQDIIDFVDYANIFPLDNVTLTKPLKYELRIK